MGEGGGGEDLSESRLFHILHDDIKNLRRSTNSEMSWIICECNICIEEFYLHHLHRESQLIFEKKTFVKLCQPTLFNTFSPTIAWALT